MNTLIYVETTVASFYTETRLDSAVQVRKQWTREWWHAEKLDTVLVTSAVAIEELELIPDETRRAEALTLIQPLQHLEYTTEVAEIVAVYLAHRLMPGDLLGDADHLALASYYRCDILATWNCQHLANANKLAHIRRVNALLGLPTPALVTPLQLLGKGPDEEA
jgi:hypothetical protein